MGVGWGGVGVITAGEKRIMSTNYLWEIESWIDRVVVVIRAGLRINIRTTIVSCGEINIH